LRAWVDLKWHKVYTKLRGKLSAGSEEDTHRGHRILSVSIVIYCGKEKGAEVYLNKGGLRV
jgi:hypothetical protein